jgi:hypothetical protein
MLSRWMWSALVGLWCLTAEAKPPIVDAAAMASAGSISAMADTDPTSRMLMLLAARDFSEPALFALAATHPGLVEQIIDEEYRVAIDYIAQLPPGELYRVRAGETVVRSPSSMTTSERNRVDTIVTAMGYKPKKFQAVRIGPLEGRVYRFEVTVLGKHKRPTAESISLAWPATPERDEQSRGVLSRHFGARPSQQGTGAGASIPLRDASFEGDGSLGQSWTVQRGVVLGLDFPTNDVKIDPSISIDGLRSLRFHASEQTRHFQSAAQQVAVPPGAVVRARAQIKADSLRVEFQQKPGDVYLQLTFLDAGGAPTSAPVRDVARLATYAWEPLELTVTAPPGAVQLRVELMSAVSGTAWFDGVSLEVR